MGGVRHTSDHLWLERRWLLEQVGNKYGWWKLGLIAAQRFTRIAFTDFMFIKDRPICSVLSAIGKAYAGVFFDREPMKCTPDNMHDYVRGSAEWTFVGRGHINGGA